MTDPQSGQRRRGGALAAMWVALGLTVALLLPLRQVDQSVTIYGLEVAVWVLAIVFYLLGLAAGWASFRARRA